MNAVVAIGGGTILVFGMVPMVPAPTAQSSSGEVKSFFRGKSPKKVYGGLSTVSGQRLQQAAGVLGSSIAAAAAALIGSKVVPLPGYPSSGTTTTSSSSAPLLLYTVQ